MQDRIKQLDCDIVHLFAQYGFTKRQKDVSDQSFFYAFVKGDLFIVFTGGINHFDYPGYVNLIVGKGDYTYPSLDTTGYALWRIKRFVEGDESTEYPLSILFDDNFLSQLQGDMEKYLMPFLQDGEMYWIR